MKLRWWAHASLSSRLTLLFGLLVTAPLLISGILLSIRGYSKIQESGERVAEVGKRALDKAADSFNELATQRLQNAAEMLANAGKISLEESTAQVAYYSRTTLQSSTEMMSNQARRALDRSSEQLLKVAGSSLNKSLGELQRISRDSLESQRSQFVEDVTRELQTSSDPIRLRLRQTILESWKILAERRVARPQEFSEAFASELVVRMQYPIRTTAIQSIAATADDVAEVKRVLLKLYRSSGPRPQIVRVVYVGQTGTEAARVPEPEEALGEEDWEGSATRKRLMATPELAVVEPLRWDERSKRWVIRVAHKVEDAGNPPDPTLDQPTAPSRFLVADYAADGLAELSRRDSTEMEVLLIDATDGKVISSVRPEELNNPVRTIWEKLPAPTTGSDFSRKPYFFTYTRGDGVSMQGAARYWGEQGNCWAVVSQPDSQVFSAVEALQDGVREAWQKAVTSVQARREQSIKSDFQRALTARERLEKGATDDMRQEAADQRIRVAAELIRYQHFQLPKLAQGLDDMVESQKWYATQQIHFAASDAAEKLIGDMALTSRLNQSNQKNRIVANSKEAADRVARQLRIYSAGLIPLFLVMAMFLASLTTRSLVRPINNLVQGTQALATGDYSRRIPVRGQDELSHLARAFNQMAEAVERAQADLQQSNDYLAAEKARIEAIANASPDGLVMLEPTGQVAFVNPAAARFLLLPQGESPEAPFEIEALPPGSAETLETCLKRAGESTVDERLEISGAQRLVLQVRLVPLRTASGRTYGRLLHLHDITREQIIDEMKSDFISLVSHELRTPLTSILGFSAYILGGKMGVVTDLQRTALESIHRQSRRLSAIISDFLDVSRIESGKIEMKKELTAVTPIAERVLQDLRPQALEKAVNMEVVLSSPADALTVMGDEQRLAQVLTNLVGNALKFTERDGSVRIFLGLEDSQVCCEVRDSGCGIPEDELDRVFDRFYQVEKVVTRKSGGTGLGLAIVKNIVEAHGGRIWINSRLGEGTQVHFSLPAAS